MHAYHVALILSSALPAPADSVSADSAAARRAHDARAAVAAPAIPSPDALRAGASWRARGDTTRVVSIEYSDWYERRLTIHRVASYATLPLFAFQYAAGRRLYDESADAPSWARTGHGIAATGVTALFAVNTVTGVWNLVESRGDPEGRKWRTAHAVLMLAADAGFAATGLLAESAERSPDDRGLHKNIAISSVAVATASYLMMLPPLRRD